MKTQPDKYAEVAPAVPLPAPGKQTYTYALPDGKTPPIPVFSRVSISLGKRHLIGTVISKHSRRLPYRVKPLQPISSLALTAKQVQLAEWISQTMLGGLGYTLRLFYPPEIKKNIRVESLPDPASPKIPPAWRIPSYPRRPAPESALVEADPVKRLRYLAWLSAKTLRNGGQVLIILPEKWQLDRAAEVFHPIFKDHLFVWYANLSARTVNQAWQQVSRGEIKVVIGTQKSLFLPFARLGLVILEDENNSIHKLWDAYPRLDNRFAARQLALIHSAGLVYSGAYPSLDLNYRLQQASVSPLLDSPLSVVPRVYPLSFADRESKRLLPLEFIRTLEGWLRRRQRVFILHNRRGTWSAIICRKCRASLKCPECGVSLSVHGRKLACHQCGYQANQPKMCPVCHTGSLRTFGIGSERAAQVLQAELKNTKVTVLDKSNLDIVSVAENISNWRRRHLFIGTTAAFSVLSRLNIDHAVLLMPEQSLLYPDFRSEERVLRQVIRLREFSRYQNIPVVTRFPRLVQEKLGVPLSEAYANILDERRRLKYPPFNVAVKLTWQARTEKSARQKAISARQKIPASTPVIVRGPFESGPNRPDQTRASHLLLLGQFSDLPGIYTPLSPDIVDVNPERIL